MSSLQKDLDALERSDSAVVRAAASLNRMYESMQARGDIPRTKFRKSTPDRPCEVLR
jgi:hypothetical protein